MKNLLKIGVVAAAMALGFSANADEVGKEVLSVGLNSEKGKQVDVVVSAKRAHFYMTNQDGEVIYEENLEQQGRAKRTFDLANLPSGNYKLVVETGLLLKRYNVSISEGAVKLSRPAVANLLKTNISKDGKMVTLNLNSLEKTPVEIEVVNEYSQQVYFEKLTDVTSLTKKFDITKGDGREFTFIVKSPSNGYTETVYKY